MPELLDFSRRKGLWLVEDAAHAHGSSYAASPRAPSACGCLQLLSHEGDDVAEGEDDRHERRRRRLRGPHLPRPGQGQLHAERDVRMGYNWRMSEPHAIIGLRHLERLR